MKHAVVLFCLCALTMLAGCAARQDQAAGDVSSSVGDSLVIASLDDDAYLDSAYSTQLIPDPFEPWNRGAFIFNDGLITYAAHPLNTAYTAVVPRLLRDSVRNFFFNLMFPVRFINNLLQGKGRMASLEFSRFIINTSAGIGGLFNVASRHPEFDGMDPEDMGQTFAVWGVGEGPYIYWPLLGPSTSRDSVGRVGDYFLDPLTYINPWQLSWSLTGARVFTELDSILDAYDSVTKSAIEPYTAVRDAFVQYRRARVAK